MPSAGLPARDTLKLQGQTTIAWAVFDPRWYLATYADAQGELESADDAAVLQHYLSHGQALGHSPNIWFDEQWHLRRYPGLLAVVREGHAESAFDSYCRSGYRMQSPHWLFDELLYRQLYPDLSDDALAHDGSVNGYDHYLKHGAREGRIGHLLFDPKVYRSQLVDNERADADGVGGYLHYLARITQRQPEIRTSHHFDPVWYVHRYRAATEGTWRCALHHYLANETPTEFDPLPEFSEAYYLQHNTDVAAAVEAGDWRNGYEHFLYHGSVELRAPCTAIDLQYYVGTHPIVRNDIDAGRARDAFFHYLAIGREQGLTATPVAAPYRQDAQTWLPMAARTALDFRCHDAPAISVAAVLRDPLPSELRMLTALRAAFAGDIDLILIDADPAGEAQRIERSLTGARVLRLDKNADLVPLVNVALDRVSASAVLFIDGAMEFAPGTLSAALQRLRSDPMIGAVGGKLLCADGRLAAAGGIVWRDGSTSSYLSAASPLVPEANFVRDVDWLAGLLLLRGSALSEIEGFDDAFSLDDYGVADLCLRLTEAGFQVVYDPAIAITYLSPRHGSQRSEVGRETLFRKHANRLARHHVLDPKMEVFARSSSRGRRVLFIDDLLPLRRLGSGFVRSNDLLQVMAALGYRVTVYPVKASRFGLTEIYADMPDTAEVMHDRTSDGLAEFLLTRQGYYDAIWIVRTHNLDQITPTLERTIAEPGHSPRIILDTEAIAALRAAEHAAVTGSVGVDVDAAIMREFANAHLCRRIIAVNALEAQKLRQVGFSDVTVIGHRREAQPTPRAFGERAGMLFLAAIHEQDSPNRDALDWFVAKVLPLVEDSLGWETRLTVAGHAGAGLSFDEYRNHARITLRGPVENVVPLYDAHRVVVAPTRYSAGLPYKVHEAASYGVPVVATDLLCRQLGWRHGHDLLAADAKDPVAFARHVVAVYRDPGLWQLLRDNALARIREENGLATYEQAVRQVIEA